MGQIRRRCPFCLERVGSVGSRENISVDTEKGVYYCWRCGKAGRVTKWIAKTLDVPEVLAKPSDLLQIIGEEKPREKVASSFPEGFVPLYPWREVKDSIALRRFVKYLRRRKVTPKLMESFKLGVVFDPPEDLWYMAGNIIYPIMDGDRKGYIRKNPKHQGYSNSKGLTRDGALYNGRVLDKLDSIFVVEGVHDTLAMKGHAVATLGTSVTEEQLDRLTSFDGEVIIAHDGDAWRNSMVIARRLNLRGKENASWVKIPAGRDPGNLGYDEVVNLPTRTYI